MKGTGLGHRWCENRLDEGSPYREIRDRVEKRLGVPSLRGRIGCGQGTGTLQVTRVRAWPPGL